MKVSRRTVVATSMAALLSGQAQTRPRKTSKSKSPANLGLWYGQPAKDWSEALPLGNGRLGAMVFGGVSQERIQINEQTLWGGGPRDYNNGDKTNVLRQLRLDIFEGKLEQATELGKSFLGKPATLLPYQPFVDLSIAMDGHESSENYIRELDLASGVHKVSYLANGAQYSRETFISFPDKVLVVRLAADKPAALSAVIGLSTQQTMASIYRDEDGTFVLAGQIGPRENPDWSWTASWSEPGLKYAARMVIKTRGGKITNLEGKAKVEAADEVLIVFAGATSFKSYKDISGDPLAATRETIKKANLKAYADIMRTHQADHGALFNRVGITLATDPSLDKLPTDRRLERYKTQPDSGLEALYFQYGRYLLMASSRAGGQAANLQGIWNNDLLPAWSSKWTTNINLQMNYWIADSGDLWEVQTPLWDLIADLTVTGAETARKYYGANGWVLHHNSDIWRAATPVDGPWGIWPMGGVWLVNQMWDHYLFSENLTFLRSRAYPAMKGAVEFALDFLVEAPATSAVAGQLVSVPSVSPENQYKAGTASYHLTYAPTMDIELLRELFANFAEASRTLRLDGGLRRRAIAAAKRLPDTKIGAKGQIQEWIEDFPEQEPDHRHTSHLYGLYPGHSISTSKTPDLAKAAARTLQLRGDNGTGWSMAWRTSLFARLGKGDRAHDMLKRLLTEFTQKNLFDVCPPFQIDGNFGGPAGMSEMLLQSSRDEIHLLPALPATWPSGSVQGLRARGGLMVDFTWADGVLQTLSIWSPAKKHITLEFQGRRRSLSLLAGKNPYVYIASQHRDMA